MGQHVVSGRPAGSEGADNPRRDSGQSSGVDARAVLSDLPESWWPDVLSTIRNAMDQIEPGHIPRRLRPFVGWHPQRLNRGAVRDAIVSAVPDDARFRKAMLDHLTNVTPDLADAAQDTDTTRLLERYNPGTAAAALIARERWEALAVASAQHREDTARDAVGNQPEAVVNELKGTAPGRPESLGRDAEDNRGDDGSRRERERELERAAAEAARRAENVASELARVKQRLADVEGERDELASRLRDAQSRYRSRLARLRRHTRDARSLADDRDQRIQGLADQLSRLLQELTTEPALRDKPASQDTTDVTESRRVTTTTNVPRRVRAAVPGRPCRLPPGIAEESVPAVESLLQVQDLELMLDGYNVTKDLRGQPTAPLPQQRLWLVRTVAGVTAMYSVRPTIVFDGQERSAARTPSARGVRVIFTGQHELADDRIKEYVESMGIDVPVLVVTSDREIREDVSKLGANVISSGTFLSAIGASS